MSKIPPTPQHAVFISQQRQRKKQELLDEIRKIVREELQRSKARTADAISLGVK